MPKIKKTVTMIDTVKLRKEVRILMDKGKSGRGLRVDIISDFQTLEGPLFLLVEGVSAMMADIYKIIKDNPNAKEEYNELVQEVIKEFKKNLIFHL